MKILGFKFFGDKDTVTSGFKVLGDGVWLAKYTNNFVDLEQEAFSLKAHHDYVARVDAGLVPLPELRYWHHPALKIGQASKVFVEGNSVYAYGTFDDNPLAKVVETYAKRNPNDVSMSHGFYYPTWGFDGKVYSSYNTFEVTVLPRGKEANPYTAFTALEEETDMPINQEILEDIAKKAGKTVDDVKTWFDANNEADKATADVVSSYKDFADIAAAQTPAVDPEPPDVASNGLLGTLLEQQEESAKQIAALATALNGLIEQAKARDKALQEAMATTKALHDRLNEAPRHVQDGMARTTPAPSEVTKVLKLQGSGKNMADDFWGLD